MATAFIVYYSIFGAVRDLDDHGSAPVAGRGGLDPRSSNRRPSWPASCGAPRGQVWSTVGDDHSGDPRITGTPVYLIRTDTRLVMVAFSIQGLRRRDLRPEPGYLTERFPTEVRATAAAFCYHQAAIFGGTVAPILTYLSATYSTTLAIPMPQSLPAAVLSVSYLPSTADRKQRARLRVADLGKLLVGAAGDD